MRGVLLICAFSAVLCVGFCEKVRFDDYSVYKIHVDNKDQLSALQTLQEKNYGSLDFWKEPISIGDDCLVMVSPDKVNFLKSLLEGYGMRSNVTIPDVQKIIDDQSRKFRTKFPLEWTDYHTLEEIYDWLDVIQRKYKKVVKSFDIGRSYEGRRIRGIKISYKEGNRAVFIEANIHAREWISSAVITWMINQFLTSTDPAVRDMVENIDWYIVPVFNTDGFEYTHTTNRMWRKTRQPHTNGCYGADPNRNFNFTWMVAGASSDPCSDTYAGPRPESEPEVAAVSRFVSNLKNVKLYISLHSFGQLLLSPWGHTKDTPKNYEDMLAVAKGFADAAKVKFDTQFRYGSSALTLYKVSGSSKDWAYGVHSIPLTYTIELRDKGKHGFLLPPEQIIPTAQEVLDGFVGLTKVAKALAYF